MLPKITVCLMIDGWRWDFIQHMPYLSQLKENSLFYDDLEETFGFIGIRPAIFAGIYPSESGYVFLFKKNSNKKNLFFQHFRFVPKIISDAHSYKKFLTKVYSKLLKIINLITKRNYIFIWPIDNFPSKMLQYVDISEKNAPSSHYYLPHHKTLFDFLLPKEYLFLGYPNHSGRTGDLIQDFSQKIKSQRFLWIHFSELDQTAHYWGPDSKETLEKLLEIDKAIKIIYHKLKENFSNINLLIFGDHGSVEVKENINIINEFNKRGLNQVKEFLYFIDSTMVRIWSQDENKLNLVKSVLNKFSSKLSSISPSDLEKKYHCKYKRDVFGDLLYVANEGIQFFPNLFQSEKPNKGMHGYLPEVKNNKTALFFYSTQQNLSFNKQNIEMVDIFPTICKLLDIPIPKSNQGKSFISEST